MVFVLCFLLFGFLSINNYVYFSFDFEWSSLMFLSYFWIDFTYVLVTNRYKSRILKPKNRFYLYFGCKVDTNYVLLNQRTDWDPNPKVHRVVPVLWRFTNSDMNQREPEPVPNRTHIIRIGLILINPKNQDPIGQNRNPIGTPNAPCLRFAVNFMNFVFFFNI